MRQSGGGEVPHPTSPTPQERVGGGCGGGGAAGGGSGGVDGGEGAS